MTIPLFKSFFFQERWRTSSIRLPQPQPELYNTKLTRQNHLPGKLSPFDKLTEYD